MTHEDPERGYPEYGHPDHHGGPEHDHSLPDATTIPETSDVEASLAPMMEYHSDGSNGAEPGWWERPDAATQIPRWAGTEPNEV